MRQWKFGAIVGASVFRAPAVSYKAVVKPNIEDTFVVLMKRSNNTCLSKIISKHTYCPQEWSVLGMSKSTKNSHFHGK